MGLRFEKEERISRECPVQKEQGFRPGRLEAKNLKFKKKMKMKMKKIHHRKHLPTTGEETGCQAHLPAIVGKSQAPRETWVEAEQWQAVVSGGGRGLRGKSAPDSTATAESLTGAALELDTQCNTTPQAMQLQGGVTRLLQHS